jgi:hypothetical protein
MNDHCATTKCVTSRWRFRPGCGRRFLQRWLSAVVASVLVFGGWNLALAVNVEEVRWGFDGRVVHHRFNVVSILLSNPSETPFEGRLQLRRFYGNTSVGAVLEEPVFISPYATRWVQFYPYVMSAGEEWTLIWGRGGRERSTLNPPGKGEPALVLLEDPSSLIQGGRGLKRFPDNLFPPHVTATDGLQAVVLDHVPRWEQSRRQAFLDWLHGGGIVHILHGADGRFPQFPAALADLNSPLDVQRVGAGYVFRHARDRNGVDGDFLHRAVLRQTAPQQAVADEIDGGNRAGRRSGRANTDADAYDYSYGQWEGDLNLFTKLKSLTQAHHNWALIYLLSFVYILCIFPGCYLLGWKRVDYRLTFGALLATVAVFSLAFAQVGRRGYGEATAVHSVAIARALPDGYYNVTQWTNVFVTGGDDYLLEHGGTGRVYSTCQQAEAVNGVIQCGVQGAFLVDIPPYSSRTFGHKTKLEAGDFEVQVQSVQAGPDGLKELVLSTGKNFPEQPKQMYALFRDRFYSLKRADADGRIEMVANAGAIAGFLNLDEIDRYYRFNPWSRPDVSAEDVFDEMPPLLIARSLGLHAPRQVEDFSLPDDQVRIFVYAPMPERFFVLEPRLRRQAGYVLYCLELPLVVGSRKAGG